MKTCHQERLKICGTCMIGATSEIYGKLWSRRLQQNNVLQKWPQVAGRILEQFILGNGK